MDKTIKIACEGAGLVQIDQVKPLQGNLKTLSGEAFKRLKSSIIDLGFSFPICAWRDKAGEVWCIDAHQRIETLKRMRDEGYEIPPLPVTWVEAKNKNQAARKLLAAASQYGEISPDGLREFVLEFEIDTGQIDDLFQFPEIDLAQILASDPSPDESMGSMKDKFIAPPFSVLNAREGTWQDRKRQWISLGIQSELGRGGQVFHDHQWMKDNCKTFQASKVYLVEREREPQPSKAKKDSRGYAAKPKRSL